ncbi:MAG: hypothetical protein LBB73_04600 [Dysgonamonadaceae bacterium]|nr:hypothetical protein [Dysgonamonadaceae bacterium]
MIQGVDSALSGLGECGALRSQGLPCANDYRAFSPPVWLMTGMTQDLRAFSLPV